MTLTTWNLFILQFLLRNGCPSVPPRPPNAHKIYSLRKTGKSISQVWRSEMESCEWSLILRKNRPWKLLSFACVVSLSVVTSRVVSLQQSYFESLQNVFKKKKNLDVCINIFRFLSVLKRINIAVWFCSSFIVTCFTFFCVQLSTPKPILPVLWFGDR